MEELEVLLAKPVGELTKDEIRILQANSKNFLDKFKNFEDGYSTFNIDDYSSVLITENEIIINNDGGNRISIDSVFKNFLIQELLNSINNRKIAVEANEIELAQRLIEIG